MSEITIKRGTVEQVNAKGTGLKMDGVWLNYTKPEYRQGKPWHDPQKGDRVELHISGDWIQAIIPLNGGSTVVNNDVPYADAEGWAEPPPAAPEQGFTAQGGVSQHTKEIMAEIAVKLAVDCYIAGKIEWSTIRDVTVFFTECQVEAAS